MMFWVLAACLTALAAMALLAPLARGRDGVGPSAAHDVEVYSDQLAELDRDMTAGTIGEDEAANAHAEIARRLLRASKAANTGPSGKALAGLARSAGAVVIVGLPLIAMSFYLATGRPDLPHQPLAARQNDPQAAGSDIAELIGRAERHLAANPDDGRGWDILAPIYLRLGRLGEARTAYANAIRLLEPTAERHSGYGETLVTLASGVVTEEARLAFQTALELRPGDPKSAFYLATALDQEGREEAARAAYGELAADSPPDAPWMAAVNQRLSALDGVGGPTRDEVAAAAENLQGMNGADRRTAIEGMVGGLDARLERDPNDLDGWIRLVRSYAVLGRPDEAQAALRRALAVFPASGTDGGALVDAARRSGIRLSDEGGVE